MDNKTASLSIQKWGNSLAVRIPAGLARSAHFSLGTPVELVAQMEGVMIKPSLNKKLTLDERLALFDPEQHGGEAMAFQPIGKEKL